MKLYWIFLLALTSCTVKYTYLTETYDQEERHQVKRLLMANVGLPQRALIEKTFFHVARDYIAHHTDFILLPPSPFKKGRVDLNAGSLCPKGPLPSYEGVLLNFFEKFVESEDDVELQLHTLIYDCKKNKVVWIARGENSYDKEDEDLKTTVKAYSERIGSDAGPFVPPFYHFVRSVFDELPTPVLNESEVDEKIENDASF